MHRFTLKGTFDKPADAAYLPLISNLADGAAVAQILVDDARLAGMIVIDLDVNNKVLGIEIVGVAGVVGNDSLIR
jgi:uncharacterized protein YuzE